MVKPADADKVMDMMACAITNLTSEMRKLAWKQSQGRDEPIDITSVLGWMMPLQRYDDPDSIYVVIERKHLKKAVAVNE